MFIILGRNYQIPGGFLAYHLNAHLGVSFLPNGLLHGEKINVWCKVPFTLISSAQISNSDAKMGRIR